MAETQYLALLRGINVGGKNIIKMTDLKACFESLGLSDVTTFIQSGNVVFRSADRNKASLTAGIEKALSERFLYLSRIMLHSDRELKKVIESAPEGFGAKPDLYRYDVIFLKEPLTAREAMKSIRTKEGVDTAHAGKQVLYFSRLTSKAAQSYLTRMITLPIYQNMTIRNWNTTTKLLDLMEKRKSNEA